MNSKDCLRNAETCIERASHATSEDARVEFLQLATAWMQIAEEIDSLQFEVRALQ
jgi:hypothetical protein